MAAQDWKDQLVRYDGQEITYAENQVGCPAAYRCMTLTWNELQGKLTGISRDGKELARYAYASDGTRYEKTAGGHTTAYHYNNGLLLSQTTDTEKLNFYYDSAGKVLQLGYQKKKETGWDTERTYFFARNAFGDIIAVYRNSDSKLMGTYEYDLWGRPVSVKEAAAGIDTDNILELNPYRYRGYYYDAESGLYYLNARYYDPEARRFVNADDVSLLAVSATGLTDKNLFAYCDNNPVMREDKGGQFWNIIVGAAIGGGLELAGQLLSGKSISEVNWAKVGVSVLSGGLTAAVGPVAGCFISGATDVAMDALDGNINSLGDAVNTFAWSTTKAIVSYGIGEKVGTVTKRLTKIEEVGRLGKGGYPGVKYSFNKGSCGNRAVRSIELHPRHNNHGIHIQGNKWNTQTGKRSGTFFRKTLWR